ncbi:MAG: hypothetical protein N2651_00070 [Fimbriimonadales bacterium]|nr:hypothetical protein [Fimbriimonadales bacterium]
MGKILPLESLLRDWLKERMRDYYALDYIEPEVAQAVLRIWCAGESLGFPSVTLRREVYGRSEECVVPAGAENWLVWLQHHADTVWQDALYRAVIPPQPVRGRGDGSDATR